MNNIQKAFKTKSQLRCMADGGLVDGKNRIRNEQTASNVATGVTKAIADGVGRSAAQEAGSFLIKKVAPRLGGPVVAAASMGAAIGGQIHKRLPIETSDAIGGTIDSALRRMADGGPVQQDVTGLRSRQSRLDAAIDGASGGKPAPKAAAPAAAKPAYRDPMAPIPNTVYPKVVPQKPKGIMDKLFGMAHGGKVRGPGGPTDDKVGPIMLSDGEYVLPADTVDHIGKENLDELLDATHEPVKEKKGLRGMVNGGLADDLVGNEIRNPRMAKAVVQAAGEATPEARNAALRSGGYRAFDAGKAGLGQRVGNFLASTGSTAAEATLEKMGPARAAANMGGGRLGGFVRGGLPAAGIAGAVESFQDLGNGRREASQRDLGVATPVGSVVADAARVMGNVGNAATFGLAGRLGRGISNATGGGSFIDGAMSDGTELSQQPQQSFANTRSGSRSVPGILRSDAGNVMPVAPGTYQSNRLAEMGVPVDQQNQAPIVLDRPNPNLANPDGRQANYLRTATGTPGQYQNLGSYGGDANIYGTASKPGGRIDTFKGVGAQSSATSSQQAAPSNPIMDELRAALRSRGSGGGGGSFDNGRSNADAINERFDKLNSGLESKYRSSKAGGNLAARQLELEGLRSKALEGDQDNLTEIRGQNSTSALAAAGRDTAARDSDLRTLTALAGQQSDATARGETERLKAAQTTQEAGVKAEEAATKRDEAGLTDIRAGVLARYGEDVAGGQDALSRIQSAGEGQIGRVTSAVGQDRAAAIEDLLDSVKIAQSFDGEQSGLRGRLDSGLPRTSKPRDPRFFEDVDNGAKILPAFGREVSSLFGGNADVNVDEIGRVAPKSSDLRIGRAERRAREDAANRIRNQR